MDRITYLSSIHHSGSSRYVSPSQPRLGDSVSLRLRATVTPHIQQVLCRTAPDGEQHFAKCEPLNRAESDVCVWWITSLSITMPVTSYRFLVITDEGAYWYNASGLHAYNPTDAEDFKLLADFQAPGWLKDAVFYQIFPDRFADGDPSTNVRDGEYEYAGYKARVRKWGELPTKGSRAAMVEFYGGDLPGILSHLDYIQDLGVNALYLNPVFTAYSNHRYDVTDYFSVDPHLGGDQALVDLGSELTQRGMHYILDIVPNHCGVMHPWFQAALADPHAPTAGYFTFRKHPQDYETWLGVRTLVKLNYQSEDLRNVMYAGHDSVFRRWLRAPYSADGWRIDVANMLGRQGANQLGTEVSRGIRRAVKDENPQAYLMGENCFDATQQLQGDSWDGVMNYSGFAMPLLSWLSPASIYMPGQAEGFNTGSALSTPALLDGWAAFRATIPWVIATQQYNLIDTHDTPRALSLAKGDRALFHLAVALLFTYPGVPSVYYGDEIGLGGGKEKEPRLCMSWEPATWDVELLGWYKELIRLRRSSPALIDGGFQVVFVDDDTFVYQRDAEDEVILVAARRGTHTRTGGPIPVYHAAIRDGTEFAELFTHQKLVVENGHFPLPDLAPGAKIWLAKNI